MTSLRDMFTTQTKTNSEQKVEDVLEKVAKNLRKDIEKRIRKQESDRKIVYGYAVGFGNDVDVTKLDGYKKLHDICADPDVDVRIDINFTGQFGRIALTGDYSRIVITLDEPYSASGTQPARPAPSVPPPKTHPSAAPVLSAGDSVLEMPSDELQELLARIKKARPDDFSAVADPKNPAALTHDIKATRPIGSPKRP